LHALQYIVLRYGIPPAVNHIQTYSSAALRTLLCSVQSYSTVPYSHGTLGAWPRPRDRGIARRPPQHPNPQTIFSISWHQQPRFSCFTKG